jgi:hypothetical protein
MKKFFIGMLAVLFAAGAAYAVDYDYSGMINTRGQYYSNDTGLSNDSGNYMIYDMEFDSTLKIKPDDMSLIYLNWEIHDESWLASPGGSDSKTGDDNIAIKRAFGSHTFGTGTTVDFGLMTGGAWGTSAFDTADGAYRVKFVQKTAFGVVPFLVEKKAELGSGATGDYDAEADDADLYAVGLVTKAGDINIKPLLIYVQNGAIEADEESDENTTILFVAADGSFGAVGFEGELAFKNVTRDLDTDAEDYSVYGLYLNAWTNMDALKVGGILAYSSWDDDAGTGLGFGDDFEPLTFAANATGFGGTTANDFEFNAVTLLVVYADYALSDKSTLNGAIGYYMSNTNEDADGSDNFWKDATGYELNAGWSYKISDACKYEIQGAFAQYNLDEDAAGYDDADAATRIYHKIQINF